MAATPEQAKALIYAALMASGRGFHARGTPGLDSVHFLTDTIVDAIFGAIQAFAYEGIYDPADGLPEAPTTGDTWIASSTANGWTNTRIYSWTGTEWTETVPQEGWLVWLKNVNAFYYFDGTAWYDLLSTPGTHYHSQLVYPGTTTPAWYVDADGGLVAPNGWRILTTEAEWKWQKWTGAAWEDIGRKITYIP